MQDEINEIFDKEILKTSGKPFYFYLTLSLLLALIILLIAVIVVRDLDNDGIKAVFLIFLFSGFFVYLVFGRYLSNIILFNHHIEINYLLPWNRSKKFSFNSLTEIQVRDFEFIDRLTNKWYRGGKWLFLKNEKGEVCQFRYSINSSENEKLLEELQKMCSTEIVYDYY